MERSCRGILGKRSGLVAFTSGWLIACAEPRFRDLDGGAELGESDPEVATLSGADDDFAVHRAEATPAELMRKMVGLHYMRVFFSTVDRDSAPVTTMLSLVEFTLEGDKLFMREQPCSYTGELTVFGVFATTKLDASRLPETRFELSLQDDGIGFESDQPVTAIGYDRMPPAGCMPGEVLGMVSARPWSSDQTCTCPADLVNLPEPDSFRDCRINDADGDGAPGVTVIAQVLGLDPVEMYLAQRARDHYQNIHFEADDRMAGNFFTTRTSSLLGCDPMGFNCVLGAAAACPAESNRVEWVRALDETEFTCEHLIEAAAYAPLFEGERPLSCVSSS